MALFGGIDIEVVYLLHGGIDLVASALVIGHDEKLSHLKCRILNIKSGQVSTYPDVPKELELKVDSCGRLIIGEV